MWRSKAWLAAVGLLLLVACQSARSGAASGSARELRVGDQAPDFTMMDQNHQMVTLSHLRGRPVQAAFYVWAFSGG